MPSAHIDYGKFEAMVWGSRELDTLLQDKAQLVNKTAAAIFTAENKKFNEHRVSETTPPKYLASFGTRRNPQSGGRFSWVAFNDDPAAMWVEVGARAGGHTAVLKYRPYGRSLDLLRIR